MSKRKYEVEIQIAQTKIYHVEAKDEEDLLNKEKSGDIENEGKLIKTNTSESMLGGWSFIENVK